MWVNEGSPGEPSGGERISPQRVFTATPNCISTCSCNFPGRDGKRPVEMAPKLRCRIRYMFGVFVQLWAGSKGVTDGQRTTGHEPERDEVEPRRELTPV